MSVRVRCRLLLALSLTGLAAPQAAGAATTTLLPPSPQARNFQGGAGGWTPLVTEDCGLPGIACADGSAAHQTDPGGNGYLRAGFQTLLGVPGATTVTWRSPAFTAPADTDQATLGVSVRSNLVTVLGLGASSQLTLALVDQDDASRSTVVASTVPIPESASFAPLRYPVPAGALRGGHSYRVELRSRLTTGTAAVARGGFVNFDDVSLTAVDLLPPAGLTAAVDQSGSLRVVGSLDPRGQDTSVVVEYGPTAAYTASTAPVIVGGSGTKGFSIPFAGLTPGVTLHYRVTATSADGSASTSDATFVVPAPPSNAAPSVAGAPNSRSRTVAYDVTPGTAGARIELTNASGTVVATVADLDLDGSVVVTLPATDGSYGVRVVRTAVGGQNSTSASVPVTLDTLAPATAGVGLAVSPESSASRQRVVSLTPPADAMSVSAQVVDAAGVAVGAPVAVTGGMATVDLPGTDGAYRVLVTLTDAAGNAAQVTSAPVTLDSAAPDTGSAPLVSGAGNSRNRSVAFERDPDAASVVVEVRDAVGNLVDSQIVPSGSSADVTLGTGDGTYEIRVRQTDGAGNEAVSPVTAVTLDTVAPIAGPAPTVGGAGNVTQRTVSFVRDPQATAAQVQVLDANGSVLRAVPAVGNTATIELGPQDGEYGVRVVQTDAAGNVATSPASATALDTAAPDAGPAPTVTGAADDRDRTVTFVRDPSTVSAVIEVRDANGNVVSTTNAGGDSASISLPANAGTYSISVVQTDAAGNASTSPPTRVALAPEQTGPTGPSDPGTPAEPTGPTGPGAPTGPTGPSPTTVPTDPGGNPPANPADPADPNVPAEPADPPAPGPSRSLTDREFRLLISRVEFTAETGTGVGGTAVPMSSCTIVGTPGNDVLVGTGGHDVICGLGGRDIIRGAGSGDLIDGGNGTDRLSGGAGRDLLLGLAGNDRLRGGAGDDMTSGGAGNDVAKGNAGNDRLFCGSGRDRGVGGGGDDRLNGGRGNDRAAGGAGRDRLIAGAGDDHAYGGAGRDIVSAGSGADRLAGGGGTDRVDGGAGMDTLGDDATEDRVQDAELT